MSNYGDKRAAIIEASNDAEEVIQRHNLHPTDRAEAYREIERQAGVAATMQEEKNSEGGVPERAKDQEKTAISDRLDGGL